MYLTLKILVSFGWILGVTCRTYICKELSFSKFVRPTSTPEKLTTNRRRFGSILPIKPGETLIAVLGTNQGLHSFNLDLINKTTSKKDFDETDGFDCSFGISSTRNLTLTIHWWGFVNNCNAFVHIFQAGEKTTVSLHEKGTIGLNPTSLIPVNLRISTCGNKNYGLAIVATAQGDSGPTLMASFLKTFTSFFAPFILFTFVTIMLGCCFLSRYRGKSSSQVPKQDKPPKYDDLFPRNVKFESPPTYEECLKRQFLGRNSSSEEQTT